MLETVGEFRLQYDEQAQGTLGSMMATPSLLRRVIESQVQDSELVSIRDRVQLGTADEGWAIHTMVVFGIGDELWSPSRRI